MPKLTINGKEVEVNEGTTIIEAYKSMDEDIAHYCWHPGLSVAGVCRLCMVEVEGMPKPQVACNTVVKEGMVVNNDSELIKKTVRWGLDFHLINHPLDCPVCDQAGECGLQEQYMKFGQYDPEMAEHKVKKRKVVDLGERVVLDSERCILCSRCVRFTDEVSKTHELGIFNRGDRSEIGTVKDKPLNNKYSLNTVDICPVGALTSKDFRFQQRVWYLKNNKTVCAGCSTGCNVAVYYNEEGLFRVRPEYNKEVNGYWMCDDGRDLYKYVNREKRLVSARIGKEAQWTEEAPLKALKKITMELKNQVKEKGSGSVGVVLTGQNTLEEYQSFFTGLKKIGVNQFFHWKNNEKSFDEFDGLLIRGDKNPNTKGLEQALKEHSLVFQSVSLSQKIEKEIEFLIVVGPENQNVYPNLQEWVKQVSQVSRLVWLSANPVEELQDIKAETTLLPMKTFVEKSGTFINHQGLSQTIDKVVTLVPEAFTLLDVATSLAGEELEVDPQKLRLAEVLKKTLKQNHFTSSRGSL